MRINSIKDLTLTSVLTAIMLVMIFVPFLGFIPLGALSLTLIHIPVLIGVFLLPSRYAIFLGFMFGAGSWIRAIILPQTPIDPAFQNPLVSVLPRVLFVIGAILLFKLFKWIESNVKNFDRWFFLLVSILSSLVLYYGFQAISDQVGWTFARWVPFVIIGSAVLIETYQNFIKNKKINEIIYPSVLLVSTMFHTLIVLSSLVIFEQRFLVEELLIEDFLGVIYAVAMTNGMLESLLAALIGTPIILALKQLKNRNEMS